MNLYKLSDFHRELDAKLVIATSARATPIIEISPPLTKTHLWKIQQFAYGVLREGVVAEICLKISAKSLQTFRRVSTLLSARKMSINFLCTLNTPSVPEHPSTIPRTSQVPPFQTQGRQTFEGGDELFDSHPFAWKTPSPPGGLQTQKVNLCALFSSAELPQKICKDPFVSVATPAEPRGEKIFNFCRFWAVKNF